MDVGTTIGSRVDFSERKIYAAALVLPPFEINMGCIVLGECASCPPGQTSVVYAFFICHILLVNQEQLMHIQGLGLDVQGPHEAGARLCLHAFGSLSQCDCVIFVLCLQTPPFPYPPFLTLNLTTSQSTYPQPPCSTLLQKSRRGAWL